MIAALALFTPAAVTEQPYVMAPPLQARPSELFSCHGFSRHEKKESRIDLQFEGGSTNGNIPARGQSISGRKMTVLEDSSPLNLPNFEQKVIGEAMNGVVARFEEARAADQKGPPPRKIQVELEYDALSRANVPFVPLIIRGMLSGYGTDPASSATPVVWLGVCSRTVTAAREPAGTSK